MGQEIEMVMEWVFIREIDLPSDVYDLLIAGEKPVCAFKTLRGAAIFTDRRLIVRNVQGLTGKKKEIFSLPYRAIEIYSTENAGHLDLTAEVELWTKLGNFKISLKRGADVRRIDQIIAEAIL